MARGGRVMSTVPPPLPFRCPICEKGFQTQAALDGHSGSHVRNASPAEWTTPPRERKGALRCAIYGRVSTDDRDQDPTQQLDVLRRKAQERGFEIVWEGADEWGGDSDLWDRPEGKRLWNTVSAGKIDVIMTWDTSRLSRQHPVNVFQLLGTLQRRGIAYVSATEAYFDTTTENDFRDLILFIIAWFNNYFLKQLRRATVRGKAASKARGVPQGPHSRHCGVPVERGGDGPCPTGAHDENGRSLRPKRKRRKPSPPPSPPQNFDLGAAGSGGA